MFFFCKILQYNKYTHLIFYGDNVNVRNIKVHCRHKIAVIFTIKQDYYNKIIIQKSETQNYLNANVALNALNVDSNLTRKNILFCLLR